ncbi:hypothetical protein NXW41_22355 [Bacteroides thetaiotaomicron]|nr:hypothetical protein [Bacteroides thetaiotaomicron]MCS3000935.1 hypothetical protein [Bacteroides thetaiotaomicron]
MLLHYFCGGLQKVALWFFLAAFRLLRFSVSRSKAIIVTIQVRKVFGCVFRERGRGKAKPRADTRRRRRSRVSRMRATKARHLHNGIAGNTSIRFGRPNSASNRY